LGNKYGWLAQLRKDRWHNTPTALHGGLGFFPAFVGGGTYVLLSYIATIKAIDCSGIDDKAGQLFALLLGSIIMLLFGWADDLKHYKPLIKLVFQLFAASIFIFFGGIFPFSNYFIIDLLITYFWFAGIINAVNMLDNMDGLSSGTVIIASVALMLLAANSTNSQPIAVSIGGVLSVALLGFWIFNRPPATIFMGDSGSLSIGFVVAALTIPSSLNDYLGIQQIGGGVGTILVVLIPVLVLAVPIFDTTFVTINRKLHGTQITQGGRDHISHRLIIYGFNEKKVLRFLYSLSVLGGAIAVIILVYPVTMIIITLLYLAIILSLGFYLSHVGINENNSKKIF